MWPNWGLLCGRIGGALLYEDERATRDWLIEGSPLITQARTSYLCTLLPVVSCRGLAIYCSVMNA